MIFLQMPCKGAPKAPTFSGDPCDITDYLDDVARLCEACRAISGAEKIKYALKYVSDRDRVNLK